MPAIQRRAVGRQLGSRPATPCTAAAAAAAAAASAPPRQHTRTPPTTASRHHRRSHSRLLPERPERPHKKLSATERAALAAAEGGSAAKRGFCGCFGRKPAAAAGAANGSINGLAGPSSKASASKDGDSRVVAVRVQDAEVEISALEPAAPNARP